MVNIKPFSSLKFYIAIETLNQLSSALLIVLPLPAIVNIFVFISAIIYELLLNP
jgi:hypothetical protein